MTQTTAARSTVDLSSDYLGLRLRSPLVASAGPLTARLEPLRRLEAAGVAAVVLPSLFEEQVTHDELQAYQVFELGADSNPEATSYFPDLAGYESIADRYLRHVQEAKAALTVPVIGSLNGVTPGGWTDYARLIADAGADALELNLYRVAADPGITADRVEGELLELVATVKAVLPVPLAVKVGPFYTAFAHLAGELVRAGADGLVLFNRFYQPDIEPDSRRVVPALTLSTSADLRLPLRWTAILSGRIDACLAVTGGVHTGQDVARCLLAGADVAMMTSALLRDGPEHVATVERELVEWADACGYATVAELRGSVSQRHVADPAAFERANYIGALVDYSNTFPGRQAHAGGALAWPPVGERMGGQTDQRAGASYAAAGVDIEAGERAVALMKASVARAQRPEVVGGIGGFAGLFDASALRAYDRPLLATSTDGVGTKVAIAQRMGVHDTIGRDLVAMLVDDLVVCGAEPLFLTDYIACGRVVPERVAAIVSGIAAGCRLAGCALLGGETAEHPGVLEPDEYDLAGATTGVVEAAALLGPDRVRAGDVVVAMAASGLHANGYSLVRHVLRERAGWSLDRTVPDLGRTLGEELLEPTRIYAPDALALVAAPQVQVHAMSHVTGGGLAANLARVLPAHLSARLDRRTWAPPPVFDLVGRVGAVPQTELERTLNMGVGMAAVVAAHDADAAVALLRERGVEAWVLGEVTAGDGSASLSGDRPSA